MHTELQIKNTDFNLENILRASTIS